ncbi:CGNR zinc finger domain-containing protein [Pseudoalteromonas sp. MMG010]|uniref:CGNR zinc finger domain-containing protein n=1 Tax=Pseudoalteromonas sp. MMG010 TaxID=2822685 RepID=UPI001B3A399F|nr:CGNR zinc finger domain-containing protein [Pseudoalteromonas sp. MMG010]MBQ4833384.1 CGNR zinc finger domain-containing protein [Pseudoalteromonas sp. MMG010]
MKTTNNNFVLVGNHIVIDFVNTQIMEDALLVELLSTQEDLKSWCESVDYELDKDITSDELASVIELRQCIYNCLNASNNQDDIAKINEYISKHRPNNLLTFNKAQNSFNLTHERCAHTIESLLGKLAYECAKLLCSDQVKNIKNCSNPHCVLMFLDTSRTKKRRWCSMEICGNRAKAAKHYKKQLS